MATTVYIPGPLRAFTEGRSEVALPGAPATLGAALSSLSALHPGLRDRVLTETGDVRRHVNLFIGAERCRALDAALIGDAELSILLAVSGGA